MICREGMEVLLVQAPAKINVRLKVIGKRSDGYHELVSIMIPVTLEDRLELAVRPEEEGVVVRCTGLSLPEGDGNLVFRAASSFLAETGVRKGVRVLLHKKIPIAAGLGGGSSDAAATLVGLNAMCPGRLSRGDMHRLAVGLGADVPFFLSAVPALARGIGEDLEPLANWPQLWYVLIKPPIGVSTAWAYGKLKKTLTTRENDCTFQHLRQDRSSVAELLENDLERVTEERFPVIRRIKQALLKAGAEGALMTGSGPTVFGVFKERRPAESARRQLISQDLGEVFVVTNWEDDGGRVRAGGEGAGFRARRPERGDT